MAKIKVFTRQHLLKLLATVCKIVNFTGSGFICICSEELVLVLAIVAGPSVWGQFHIGIYLIGLLPGNKYVVTLVDHFSKWPEAAPLKDKTATIVALFLFETFCR